MGPLAKLADKRKQAGGDLFMERHEQLWSETAQYVQDAKEAVKMQKVSAPKLAADGSQIGTEDHYQAFRDVGAMAPALQTAVQLQRVLGDATGRFAQAQATTTLNVLCVSIPAPAPQQPAIEASATEVLPSDPDAGE